MAIFVHGEGGTMQPQDLRNEELKYLRSLFQTTAKRDCTVLIVAEKLTELQTWSSTLKESFARRSYHGENR